MLDALGDRERELHLLEDAAVEDVALAGLELLRVLLGVGQAPQVVLELRADGALDDLEALCLEQHLEPVPHLELADDVVLAGLHRDRGRLLGEQVVDDLDGVLDPVLGDAALDGLALTSGEVGVQLEVDPLGLADLARELVDRVADADDLGLRELEGLEHRLLGNLVAPASIIVSASRVPTTIRSSDESAICWYVGLTTNSPSIRPIRTPPTGPRKGSGEIASAAEAPLIARTSCGTTMSAERTVQMTCTSFRKPFGQSGRIGRSIMRAVSVARSVARPSRLKKPPGILPGGVHPLLDVDREREEVRVRSRAPAGRRPSRGSSCPRCERRLRRPPALRACPSRSAALLRLRRRRPWLRARC